MVATYVMAECPNQGGKGLSMAFSTYSTVLTVAHSVQVYNCQEIVHVQPNASMSSRIMCANLTHSLCLGWESAREYAPLMQLCMYN